MLDTRPQSIIDIKEAVSYFANSIEPETVAEVAEKFRKRSKIANEFHKKNSEICAMSGWSALSATY